MRTSRRLARHLGAPALTLALTTLFLGEGAAQSVTWQGSGSWSRGSYIFTETTNSFWLSNGLTLRTGPLSLSATLPVVTQNSGVVSFVGGLPIPTGGEDSGAVRRRREGGTVGTRQGQGGSGDGSGGDGTGNGGGTSGGGGSAARVTDGVLSRAPVVTDDSLSVVYRDSYEFDVGDPLLSGSLELYSSGGALRSVGIGISAKAPLRTIDSGVGTGAWDVGVGTSLTAGSARTLLFVDVAWWSFGDLPDLELDAGWIWGASLSRSFSGGDAAVSATVSGASALIETVEAPLSVGVGLLWLPRVGRALSAGASFGLTEAAPDISVYLGWSLRLIG